MMDKGVSLIVLIITIIVMIILTGTIVLTFVNNNPINSAIEAKYKEDLTNLNKAAQLNLMSDVIKNSNILELTITQKEQIIQYIPQLKGTQYEEKVYIEKGSIVLKGIMLSKEEIQWAKDIHIKVDSLPVIHTLQLSSTETEINAIVTIEEHTEIKGYRFRISGAGVTDQWIEQVDNAAVFTGLKPAEEYTIEAIVFTENADSISKIEKIATKGVEEFTKIVTLPLEWTNKEVRITITHNSIPNGYIMQYKLAEQDWQIYIGPLEVTENTNIKARLYHTVLNDEIAVSSSNITNIDKTVPTVPTAIDIVSTGYNSITVQAIGSSDAGSGLAGYEYSIDGTNYSATTVDNFVIENVKSGVSVTVYARSKDKVGLVSAVKNVTTSTTGVSEQVEIIATPVIWINGSVTVTLLHSSIPSGYVLQYKIDSGSWISYSGAFSQGENGSIKARLYHTVLNDEIAVSSSNITNIDKTVPTVPTEINVVSTGYNSITVQSIGSSDAGSGLAGYEYSIDGTNYSATTVDNFVIENVKSGVSVTVYARSKDKVGLVSAVVNKVVTTLQVSEKVTLIPSTTGWTNADVEVTLSHNNIPTGYILQYKQGATNWTTYQVPVKISASTTISARLYHVGLNDEIASTNLDITNIEKNKPTAPVVNLNGYTNNSWTNENVTITYSSNDTQSGIKTYQMSNNGSLWYDVGASKVIDFDTSDWNFKVRAIDNAGNISDESATYRIMRNANGPVYSRYEIVNETSTGYDVYLYDVWSPAGMNRVQFPTWTALNGQDDLDGNWQTSTQSGGTDLGNGTWKFRVNVSEHNNEFGTYITHIYLYDNHGKITFIALETTIIDPSIVSTFYLSETDANFDGSKFYSKAGQINNNYTVEFEAKPKDTILLGTTGQTLALSGPHRYVIQETHQGDIPNAGLGVSLGINGINLVAHSGGYYTSLLSYKADLSLHNKYKITVMNRVPRLYINNVLVAEGVPPDSAYTNLLMQFVIGDGCYGDYQGYANNFIFYNVVK